MGNYEGINKKFCGWSWRGRERLRVRLEGKLARARMPARWRGGWEQYGSQGFRDREGRVSPSRVKVGRGTERLF